MDLPAGILEVVRSLRPIGLWFGSSTALLARRSHRSLRPKQGVHLHYRYAVPGRNLACDDDRLPGLKMRRIVEHDA